MNPDVTNPGGQDGDEEFIQKARRAFLDAVSCPDVSLQETFDLYVRLALAQSRAEVERLKDENRSLLSNLDKKSKEIGRSEHRGNTVDYIYDKLTYYGNQIDKLREENAAYREVLEIVQFKLNHNDSLIVSQVLSKWKKDKGMIPSPDGSSGKEKVSGEIF